MKLALVFLTIFVAFSHQQYGHHFTMDRPWFSPYGQLSSYDEQSDNHDGLLNYYGDSIGRRPYPIAVFNEEGSQHIEPDHQAEISSANQETNYPDSLSRIKGHSSQSFSNEEQNARFLINLGSSSSIANPLVKTVTFSITSTCTLITFESCIPPAYLAIPIVACVRKRNVESIDLFNDQFLITPNKVQRVESTVTPSIERDSRQSPTEIASSKEEKSVVETTKDLQVEKLLRRGRFYNLWQSFATGTTITTWTTSSTTKTVTSIPTVVGGNTAALPCLPTGFKICPPAGK